jgi:hypothetical protein
MVGESLTLASSPMPLPMPIDASLTAPPGAIIDIESFSSDDIESVEEQPESPRVTPSANAMDAAPNAGANLLFMPLTIRHHTSKKP